MGGWEGEVVAISREGRWAGGQGSHDHQGGEVEGGGS